ncbi:deca-heme c-type cytochrome, partial [bacterium AH-315-K03]|nr:deca-heme c-type cytochrome [bacterium AH-315-K03]
MVGEPMIVKFPYCFFTVLFSVVFLLNEKTIAADYVGSKACESCHQSQSDKWQGSHHEMSMRHATTQSVKGNFNNQSFSSSNKQGQFYKKADEYWVNLSDPDGKLKDYQIKYTFGVEPLQQYMVEFDDGRVQLIPFAWDTREAKKGGQRWFDLYPESSQKHQEFFWTNTGQNWNYMCADCHSTHVKKNFTVKDNTYNTTFSEINVGCEACHGPASKHMAWAKHPNDKLINAGFNRHLGKVVSNWKPIAGKTTLVAEITPSSNPSQQTVVCAQCHSRHVQISENDYVKSDALGDRYLLNLIDANRYYPDGQVYDEDYVYGSFLQSKMHKNGVVCSNCHDPHSAKLTLPKE